MRELISIIVPCYNESEALPLFMKEMDKVAHQMHELNFEIILVDDGSIDNTKQIIKQIAEVDDKVKFISFSRNFGKEAAIYAGFQHAKGSFVAMMDADLQDPPSLLPDMYKAVTEEGYDSVATRRVTRRGEPPIRSLFARCFYKIINKMSDVEIVDGARDFRLMNRKFVDALLELSEYNRFSKGLFGWVGFKNKWIDYENVERVAGKTKWSFWSLFRYSIEGIVAFTTTPLVISSIVGFIFCLLSIIAITFIVVRRLLFGDPVAGWASLTCIITFLGGVQLFCLGILGQYLAKMYLEIKKRPIYLIDESNIK
ncbi:glycosyltransferase family 2 protein [Clostridium sp. Marseille-P2415]|uniref:glycosyltransferase family 2 protein n=1 Tax=Clostridium sp. Marseille-P2415 TaxID=1805471 RepID=UPI0009886FCE|nr:glycosyltransferase family 2 protein [Clostridium sp. Marseille-P2415]